VEVLRLVKGQVAVIVDDTVTARLREDVSPQRTTGPAATPTGGSRGSAPHGRHSGPLSTGRTFMVGAFPYAVRKMLI